MAILSASMLCFNLHKIAMYSTFQKSLPKCNEAKLLEKTISRRSHVKAKAEGHAEAASEGVLPHIGKEL